jgi:diguanylate cyclase (GGDEF)-like protein
MILDTHKAFIFTQSGENSAQLKLAGLELPEFDRNLRRSLAPFDILKVKIYDIEKRIVYCTEPVLVGTVDAANKRLARALSGEVDAKLVTKERASDLKDEPLLDVDVVETYVPIISSDGRVLGSFEIYVDVTPYRDQIRQGATIINLLMTLVMSGVFGFSYLLIRRGTSQLKEAQSQLETFARTDPLTGITNRGYLLQRAEEEFTRAVREKSSVELPDTSLSCIMIDIDHFKEINDSKGHLAGDLILKEVAARFRASVRPYDLSGRYGGEEFAAFMSNTTSEQSLAIAQRIQERIRSPFTVNGEAVTITVSLGLARIHDADTSLTDLIKRTDDALYRAKAGGRDQIVCDLETVVPQAS